MEQNIPLHMLQLLKLVLLFEKLPYSEKIFKNVTSTTLPKSYFLVYFRFIKHESREYNSKVFVKRKWYGLQKKNGDFKYSNWISANNQTDVKQISFI